MKFMEECSQSDSVDKSSAKTLRGTLTTMKFNSSCTMHEHVIEMANIIIKFKSMGIKVNGNFLV